MNFLHELHPRPVAISVFGVDVAWYGILIVTAILIGLIVTLYIAKKKQVDTEHIYNLLFWLVIFCVVGGRLAHVIGDWELYKDNLIDIFKVWQGGLGFFGVLAAGLIVTVLYARIKKISFWILVDTMIIALPLVQAIGRWGNYFNQELYGRPTNSIWAIPIDFANRVAGFERFEFFHPLVLYDSILFLLMFGLMFYLFKKLKLFPGQLALIYFIMFSVVRFCLDFVRVGMPEWGPLLATQWLGIALFIFSILIFFRRYKRVNSGKAPEQ